jgi:PAS domain S-box-containing protein
VGFAVIGDVSSLPKVPTGAVPDCESSNVTGERRSLQDALAHERNVLRTMIDLIPAFIYAKDAQSRFTACNKMVAARMGVTPEQAIGKTDFDFYPREMAEKFFSDEQALLKSGKPLLDCEEAGLDTVSGTTRVIVTSKIPLHDANGNLTGFVGTGFDITERKAAEERMASSDRLESIGRLAAGVARNTPISTSMTACRSSAKASVNCWLSTSCAHIPKPGPEENDGVDTCARHRALTRVPEASRASSGSCARCLFLAADQPKCARST